MAFNPLHSLRKHQKVVMAALVFICMITFILSSGVMGGGDFFGWLGSLLTGRARAAEVATVYGDRIDLQELERIRFQRQVASDYMTQAVQVAYFSAGQKMKALEAEAKKGTDQVTAAERIRLEGIQRALEQRLATSQGSYFGGTGTTEDLLDFVIWKKQADRLGIHLTEADVSRERTVDTVEPLTRDELRMVERGLATRREQVSKEFLVQALADEFRVRLAKAALLGPDAPPQRPRQPFAQFELPTPARTQTSFTPHEFWEYYRKNRTEINVSLLPIAVRDLLPEVKDTPPPEELTALFDKHKDREPNPADPTPGFKQPRRIQIEWVSGSSKEEPYPRVAEISLAVLEATMPLAFQDQLLTQYNRNKFNFRLPGWTEEQSGKALLPVFKLPEYQEAARLPGLGLSPAQGAVLDAVIGSYQAGVVAQDLKDVGKWAEEETKIRKEFLASALAFTGLPCPPLMLTAVPPLSVAARKHAGDSWAHYPPVHVVQRHLVRNLRDAAARELLGKNLETFRKELEKLRSRPDEVQKYVAEAAKQYSFKTGRMEQPRDQFSLFEDPGLQPLREPVKETQKLMMGIHRNQEVARLFDEDPRGRLLSLQVFNSKELGRTFTPAVAFSGDANYTYWTVSDKPAYVPKFDEVKDQVAEAWRLRKARELAKKEAEQVAERVKKAGNDPYRELVDGSLHSGKLFSLDQVTRLKPPAPSPLPGRDRQYTEYRIPRSEIEFQTADFTEKLLEMKDVGDVVVLHDQPEMIYYVATPRSKRNEPMLDEFRAVYRRSSPAELFPDPLLIQFDQDRRRKQREAVMEQLRAEAKLKINREALKKDRDEP